MPARYGSADARAAGMTPRWRMIGVMTETADVIVVGAGVQGASLAFHLARRGVAGRSSSSATTVAAGATGRSSGFVRMHYDLESDARLAWASFPYFQVVGGPGRRRRLRLRADRVPAASARRRWPTASAPTSRCSRRIGIDTRVVEPSEVGAPRPGRASPTTSASAAYEPESGYADPSGTAAGFLEAARGPRRALRPGLPRARRSRSTATSSSASRPTAAGSTRRSSSTSPAPGRRGSRGPSASRSRSRPGGTTPRSSACPPGRGPTSRSSSTR